MSLIANGMEFINIDPLHNLVVFKPINGVYRSQIIQFPANSLGLALRSATYFKDVPEQKSVDDCYNWAYNCVVNGKC